MNSLAKQLYYWRSNVPWRALRVIIGLGLLFVLLRTVDWSVLGVLFQRMNILDVLLTLGINVVNLVLSAARWQVLLQAEGIQVSLLKLTRYYLWSLFFNNYLPPFVGADVVRMIAIKESKSLGIRIVSVLIERGLAIFSLLVFGGLALLADAGLRAYPIFAGSIMAALLAAVTAIAALLLPETWMWSTRILRQFPRVYSTLEEMAHAGRSYRQKPKVLLTTFVISCVIQSLVLLAFYLRAMAFDAGVTIGQTLLVAPVITLLTLLPLAPGGIGSQELFFTLTYGVIGLNKPIALAMALLARAVDLVMGLAGALSWVSAR